MKKIMMLLLLGAVVSNAAMAQTKDVKDDQKVLKNTIKDKKEDKHEAGKDLAHLRVKSAIKERKEVRHHRKSIHSQGRHLKQHGVTHPIEKAKHKAKVDKDVKNG
jgi:competence protein ComGC